jgi:hypothetical protein
MGSKLCMASAIVLMTDEPTTTLSVFNEHLPVSHHRHPIAICQSGAPLPMGVLLAGSYFACFVPELV